MGEIKPFRELNFIQTSSVIVGAVIGSGVFLNIPIVADIAGTPILTIMIWVIGGLLWIPQIMILAELSTAYPNQGGPYYYIYKAGSPFLAFQYTWTAFLTSDTPTLTIVGLIASSALSYFFPILSNTVVEKVFAASLIVVFAVIQSRSVKLGGNVQVVLTISKLLPLIAIVFFGMGYISQNAHYFTSEVSRESGIFNRMIAGISATIWAYAGFLNILYMGGEVKSPEKNLPKALFGSLIFVIAAYALISVCTFLIVPLDNIIAAKGDVVNPFKYINSFAGSAGAIFAVSIFISMLGVLNGTIMTQPRLEYAMAKDGLFFSIFGKLHPTYHTPYYSIIIQCSLAIILLLLGNIESMLGYFSISYAIQNALVYGSIIFLRRKEEYKPIYRIKGYIIVSITAIAVQLYFTFGTFIAFPLDGILISLGFILCGIPLYLFFNKRRRIET